MDDLTSPRSVRNKTPATLSATARCQDVYMLKVFYLKGCLRARSRRAPESSTFLPTDALTSVNSYIALSKDLQPFLSISRQTLCTFLPALNESEFTCVLFLLWTCRAQSANIWVNIVKYNKETLVIFFHCVEGSSWLTHKYRCIRWRPLPQRSYNRGIQPFFPIRRLHHNNSGERNCGAAVSTHASQQESPGFDSRAGWSLACSPRVCIGFLQMLQFPLTLKLCTIGSALWTPTIKRL